MNMSYQICFVCTSYACRSPFAECVTKKLLADAGMSGIEVFSMGILDWGEYPRDAAMVYVAKDLDYDLSGTTTAMTREKLMYACRLSENCRLTSFKKSRPLHVFACKGRLEI